MTHFSNTNQSLDLSSGDSKITSRQIITKCLKNQNKRVLTHCNLKVLQPYRNIKNKVEIKGYPCLSVLLHFEHKAQPHLVRNSPPHACVI